MVEIRLSYVVCANKYMGARRLRGGKTISQNVEYQLDRLLMLSFKKENRQSIKTVNQIE